MYPVSNTLEVLAQLAYISQSHSLLESCQSDNPILAKIHENMQESSMSCPIVSHHVMWLKLYYFNLTGIKSRSILSSSSS